MSKKKAKPNKNLPVKSFRKRAIQPTHSNMDKAVTAAKNIEEAELTYQVVMLRRDGNTLQEIAEVLNISVALAHDKLTKALNETIQLYQTTTEQERLLEIERLDKMYKAYSQMATENHYEMQVEPTTGLEIKVFRPPNPAYAKILLDISARKAKLLALDKPEEKKEQESGVRVYVGVNYDMV